MSLHDSFLVLWWRADTDVQVGMTAGWVGPSGSQRRFYSWWVLDLKQPKSPLYTECHTAQKSSEGDEGPISEGPFSFLPFLRRTLGSPSSSCPRLQGDWGLYNKACLVWVSLSRSFTSHQTAWPQLCRGWWGDHSSGRHLERCSPPFPAHSLGEALALLPMESR
jgi:hypothetical protein